MPGFLTEGFTSYTNAATGAELLLVDTNLSAGRVPQQAAMSLNQLRIALLGNQGTALQAMPTATATAGAATLNASYGKVTSEALTTAAGADYVLILTNSSVTANSIVLVSIQNGTNTTEGIFVTRVSPIAGAVVIRVRNNNAAALNGNILVNFVVIN